MNRSVLIVMCDFLVSAMLSMLIGVSPYGRSGHAEAKNPSDRGSAAILLDELRRRGEELEHMREQLREAQAKEGFSSTREAQLKALAEEQAEMLARSELLEEKLKLTPENTGALTPQALQKKLEEEIRKRTLASVQRKEVEAELERMRNNLRSVSDELAAMNTNYAVSQQQLSDARKAAEEREKKLENTGGELSRTREELAAQRNELAHVRSALESELLRLAEARTQTQALENSLSFTRGRLSSAERELSEARSAAEQNRKLAAQREMEVRDTQRQLADARKAMQKAVSDYSRVKIELDKSKDAVSAAAAARAEAERNLVAKQGEADTARAKLQATERELQAAEEKLRSDVLERYDASVIRLTFSLNEKRLLLDQKGGGVFYLPLVKIAGKTVMPGFHKQLFGDAEYALNFNRIDRLEYRVNMTSAPIEEAGAQLHGPLLLFPGEPRMAAIEFNMRGRKPLETLTINALKQRGLDGLFLFKPGSFGKESAPISDRCSLDLASGGAPQLYIRNTARGSSSELRAEPGDFIITKQGDFVGVVTGIENFDMGRRQEAKCYVLPENFSWDGAKTIRLEKAENAEYFEDFAKGVRAIREGRNE